jgi:DNA-binding LacI/PurR family transcriptional regulator
MPSVRRNAAPKHLRVAELLDRDIRQLPPGTPLMPVTELMERFKVSQGTVVHALRTLRMRGLITRPVGKKRLVTSTRVRSRDAVLNVLVLCPNWSSPDYNTTNQALLDEARRQRCALESVHYGAEWGKEWGVHWREILTRAVQAHDAVVVLPSSLPCELAEILHESGTPAVMLWEPELAAGMMCVADDDHAAGLMATRYLQRLGHTQIAAFLSEPQLQGMKSRLNGWEQAMREAGDADPRRLVIDGSVEPGSDSIIGSYEKLRRWLFQRDNRLDATAVFCLHWTGALAMLRALDEVGVDVPGDVSVLTHAGQNQFSEFTNPALTVVQGNVEQAARQALALLKAACVGDGPADKTVLIPQAIVERASTRRIDARTKRARHSS